MTKIRRMVLDILKPHQPTMVKVTQEVAGLDSVDSVNGTLYEVDEKVENIKLTLAGEDIDEGAVRGAVEELGGSIHSIDEVICGEGMVEESRTPQDGR